MFLTLYKQRFLWKVLLTNADKQATILTSHSLEEVEALCSKVGIMINGSLRAIGSIDRLANKFGTGFQIELQVPFDRVAGVKDWLAVKFPDVIVLSEFQGKSSHFRRFE